MEVRYLFWRGQCARQQLATGTASAAKALGSQCVLARAKRGKYALLVMLIITDEHYKSRCYFSY